MDVSHKGKGVSAFETSLERRVASVLRLGVLLSVGVMAVGAVLFLIHHGYEAPAYGVFRGQPRELRSPVGVVQGALRLRSRAVIDLGVLLLILTPVARVALSAVAFFRARDRLYTIITSVVLVVLLYSLLGGVDWSVAGADPGSSRCQSAPSPVSCTSGTPSLHSISSVTQ